MAPGARLRQDDPRLVDYNVEERVEAFVAECDKLFNVTRGNDIMITMGTDFTVRNGFKHCSCHVERLRVCWARSLQRRVPRTTGFIQLDQTMSCAQQNALRGLRLSRT